ncbi:MAG: hypothetical protein JXR94_15850 [Candidatus Hydrogenedentes bacterium]|nr:hypothetical protein [Candidatus Hydrogenedentota bacterium]
MIQVYPEYCTDANIILCPSDSRAGDMESAFFEADNLANVVGSLDGGTVPTSGNPNTDFYPCEVDERSSSYLYLGWNTMIPGVTDDSAPEVPDTVQTVDQFVTWAATNHYALIDMFDAFVGFVGGPAVLYDFDASYEDTAGPLLGQPILRLREGIERFMITDINNPAATAQGQSVIPVMGDWVSVDMISPEGFCEFNHSPGGANVLYMDGHVDFIKYPDKWPCDKSMAFIQGV